MAVMLTPSVQAGVREALRLGAVRIGWNQPTAAPPGTPTPTLIPSLLNLTGQTTLAQAQARTSFPIRLPSYPPNLGTPQYVFLQDLDGAAVMLVWIDQTHPNRAMLGLNELSSDAYVYKIAPQVVQQTAVHGQRALWTTGPYLLQIGPVAEQHNTLRRLVTASHTLIWAEGDVTYRLETDLTLTDAVHIAESLQR
jgi:hypothetical protein